MRRFAIVLAIPAILGIAGCTTAWAVGGGAALGLVAGYAANEYTKGRAKCGELQTLSVRQLELGFTVPQAAAALAAKFKIEERPLAASITASEVNFYNMISVVCALQKNSGLSTSTGTEWLKIAAGPRIELETVMQTMNASTQSILKAFGIKQGDVIALVASIKARADVNPGKTWVELTTEQNTAMKEALQQTTLQLGTLQAAQINTTSAIADLQTIVGEQALQISQLSTGTNERLRTIEDNNSVLATRFSDAIVRNTLEAEGLRKRTYFEVNATTEVGFKFNSDVVDDSSAVRLRAFAAEHLETQYAFSLVGSADPSGPEGYNQALSQRRAEAVQRVLLSAGISPARIAIAGQGTVSDRPVTERSKLRKVVVIVHAAPPIRTPPGS